MSISGPGSQAVLGLPCGRQRRQRTVCFAKVIKALRLRDKERYLAQSYDRHTLSRVCGFERLLSAPRARAFALAQASGTTIYGRKGGRLPPPRSPRGGFAVIATYLNSGRRWSRRNGNALG